jgi:hypothetical protein
LSTTGIPLIATNDALYATPDQRALHDIVTCIREGVTIQSAGRRLLANAERHLKSARGDGAAVPQISAGHRRDAGFAVAHRPSPSMISNMNIRTSRSRPAGNRRIGWSIW